jgi:Gluconate 2-dehydrogenase subunit 3
MTDLSRRVLVKSIGVAALAPATLANAAVAPSAAQSTDSTVSDSPAVFDRPLYVFFNAAEADFVEAAIERLIPPDEIGPGALQAGVNNYLDKQLGGAWGAGERLYRSGPWLLNAGDHFFNPAGLVHSVAAPPATDGGTIVSTWIVEKGKPLAEAVADEH